MSKSEQKYMNKSFDSSAEVNSSEHKNVPLEEVHPERWYEVDLDTDEVREITDNHPPTVAENLSNDPPDQGTEDHQPTEESNSHVSIPVPDPGASGEPTGITYLHEYFLFLYAIGVSVYKGGGEKRGNFILSRLQAILFVCLSVLALLQALETLKYNYFKFVTKKELNRFIFIGMNMFHIMSAIYFFKFVAFDTKKIYNMLDALRHCNVPDNVKRYSWIKFSMRQLAILLGIVSVIMSLIKTLFEGFTTQEFIQGESILQHSYVVSRAIFVWTSENLTYTLEELNENYGENFTLTTMGFGLVGSLLQFSGSLQHHVIRDIMLLAALTLYQIVADFEAHLGSGSGSADANHSNLNLGEQWKKFKTMQQISKTMANALGRLLAFLHVKNLLLFTSFLLTLLDESEERVYLLITTWSILKTFGTYIMAAKASSINQTFRTWIQEPRHLRETFEVGGVELSGSMVIGELENEPVGLGNGASFISASFFTKFFGYVVSCFLFFTKHDG